MKEELRSQGYLQLQDISFRDGIVCYENALDDKIRAHKERLERKEGYLERKQAEETKRLEQEKKVVKIIDITKRMCKQTMDTLDRTRVGKSGSASYDKFYKALLAVKMANRKARITEMKEKTEAVKGEEKQPEAEQEGKQAEGKKQHAGPDAPAL